MPDCNIILFNDFETLDAFGPAEIIGRTPDDCRLQYFSMDGGIVVSSQHIQVHTEPFSALNPAGILLVPGGMGTRTLVDHDDYIQQLKALADEAAYVLTVCTGSALLAKTGLLNGRRATSNKRAFDWVCSQNKAVQWAEKARWVVDGHFYTSSGVSAGMDMTLGFVADRHGLDVAQNVADSIEYIWNSDKNMDPFADSSV